MKFLEVVDGNWSDSFEFLKSISDDNQLDIQFEKVSSKDFSHILSDAHKINFIKNLKLIRLDIENSLKTLSLLPRQTIDVMNIGVVDHFFFEEGVWWPYLFGFQALRKSIVHTVPQLNNLIKGYVVGSSYTGMMSLSVLASLGFRHLTWVGENLDFMKDQVENLEKKFVGVVIEIEPLNLVTKLTVRGSVLINTVNLIQRPEVMADLVYFNFLEKGGLVADLGAFDRHPSFLIEANTAGLKSISKHAFSIELDCHILKKCGFEKHIHPTLLKEKWNEFLKRKISTSV